MVTSTASVRLALMNKSFRASLALALLVPCLAPTSSIAGSRRDPASHHDDAQELSRDLRTDLQAVLDDAVAQGSTPGVMLYVSGGGDDWSGAAGLADLEGDVPMSRHHRFRAGSMMKTLVATAVLQQVEQGALALDDVLTDHLPPAVTAGIQHADAIEVGMLLDHRSGIPEWVTPAVRQTMVADPAHVWSIDEVLASAGQVPMFAPGESFAYSNTNYVLLGEILGAVDGRSWREVVREEVIERAGMEDTTLPEPGDLDCRGCAHGYIPWGGSMLDATHVDPSMAGASGGHALISTVADLGSFLEQLHTGELFDHPDTLEAMLAFQPASDHGEAGGYLTGYGLGVMQLGIEGEVVIGHLGGTAGYVGFMLYVPATGRYVVGSMNVMGNPGAVILPVVRRLAEP